MFYKTFVATIVAVTLTACVGDVTINTETVVKNYPSRMQEKHPRGESVFACTTVAALYEYLEYGIISRGCGVVPMTAARYRSEFVTADGQRFWLVEFQNDFVTLFTYERRGGRRHLHHY